MAGGCGEDKAAEGECADGNVGDDDVESHHPEGKAREIDRERADEHTPRYAKGRGAQPKKTIPGWTPVVPRPKYDGDPSALLRWLVEARNAGWSQGQGRRGQWEVPDIAKVHELLDAGIDVRYTVHGETGVFCIACAQVSPCDCIEVCPCSCIDSLKFQSRTGHVG